MSDPLSNSIEKQSDLGRTPQAIARRWKIELKLAGRRESAWRKKAKEIYQIYVPENPQLNSFNILWPNTETLRQACYNSLPQPDARRRYSDEDPMGKAVGDVITRSLEFSQDCYDFNAVLQADVLAVLLPGRAVSRVRYIPTFRAIAGNPNEDAEAETETEDAEEIDWEQVVCENVQYDDFRILCAAKKWSDVTAVGFRHRMNRDELVEKFGEEIGNSISLDSVEDEEVNKSSDVSDLFKTAEVWEIWNKDEKEVLFICESYPEPCKTQPDPLKLKNFFPIPRPIYAIENNDSLVPTSLYSQYEQQAKELNKINKRINVLVEALKLRGIYDATLTELSELMKGGDNDLMPSQNVSALLERGGIEKAIFFMPIQEAAEVIKLLYEQRDSTKQVIYEITGIGDIMRSASDPNETYGAQKIKTQWGTQRLQRLQKEIQRYIRDLIRIKAEIIAEKFQMETLASMTLLPIPFQAQVDAANNAAMQQYQQQQQQAMMQYMQQAQAAQQQGQQPPPQPQPMQPPQPQTPITWEQVVGTMHNDAMRTYKIDIETDSTLSASQDSDLAGLSAVLQSVEAVISGFAPAVQQGILPFESMKEMMLAIVRRARMGSAVEDALEKMQPPPPPPPSPPDPATLKSQTDQQKMQMQGQIESQKMQQEMQLEQSRQQATMQLEQQKMQLDQQRAQLQAHVDQVNQEAQARQIQQQNAVESHYDSIKQQNEAMLEKMRIDADERNQSNLQQIQLLIAQMNNQAKIEVAEITAGSALQTAQISSAKQGSAE